MKKITLGDKVKDKVTGFVGIAIGRTIWLQGCDRVIVQPIGVDKAGKTFESQSFDEPQLAIVSAGAVKVAVEKDSTGGPRMEPHARVNIRK
jgi:hypothetical protein